MNGIYCPKCDCPFTQVQHTQHHILPRRWWGGIGPTLSICRGCHDQLEKCIPADRRMPKSFYFLVVNNFLGFDAVRDSDIYKKEVE